MSRPDDGIPGLRALRRTFLPIAFLLAGACPAFGQSTAQGEVPLELWGNVMLDFPKGEKWLFEADFEPKTLLSGGEKWWNLDFTPLVEYYPSRWIDLEGETAVGFTHQTDDVNTTELTPRIGFRLNIVNNLRDKPLLKEGPLTRIRIATLVRLEYRNFWYSDGSEPQHEWRLRVRFETKVGINHADFSEDCSLYGIFDGEYFAPIGEELDERFVSKARFRAGLGYRFRYATRLEALYIRNVHRESKGAQPQPDSNAIDVRFKLFF
jgi:Protein of unknown function (DUF2490)